MWSAIALVTETVFIWCSQVFSLYTTYGVLSIALVLYLIKRVLKSFNLI